MASTPAAAISSVLLLLLVAFAAGAGAATFTITNRCVFKVCPAAIPVGGGAELAPGSTWTLDVPAGTTPARIWPRTGCAFARPTGRGGCHTVDCAGALRCVLSGKPPATLAEFNLGSGGAPDIYGVSVVDGFNVPMDFSCGGAGGTVLRCRDPRCPDGNHRAGDGKYRTCQSDSDYQVVFCP